MNTMRKLYLLLLFGFSITQGWATHNRAGDISISQVGDCVESLTIQATIITYTKASSIPADRDTLTICWGDGNCERIARVNGLGSPPQGELLENDTKKNIYIGFHTYPTRGTYVISMTDPNRNGGVLNVNFPSSDQVKFHIQTTYTFPNPQFQGCNDTPVLLQPPIDIACVGQPFIHNPNAYDVDGDSLSYHLIVPLQDVALEVPKYQFPDMIQPGSDNTLSINEVTGDIVWDAPQQKGEYNLAMIIVEYRDGNPIDTIIRDMQILVLECENEPPVVLSEIEEICVVAGEILEFDVTASAPDFETDQLVRLTALGGPFEVEINPATFTPNNNDFQDDPLTKTFRWETACEHITDQYYSVVFKATDNYLADTSGLATLKTVRIKVVGPPPLDVQAESNQGRIEVSWEKPYFCEDAADNYFRGFTVWRREGPSNFVRDTCAPGLANSGFVRLNNIPIMDVQDNRYLYIDEDVERGRTYCYRILGIFARTTPGGQYTYNTIESLASDENCVQLGRDVPLITKVDVQRTDLNAGEIDLCWVKPRVADLDTIQNPGPYRYEIWRANGITSLEDEFEPLGITITAPFFSSPVDTCFTDLDLNTLESAYSYRIDFYANSNFIGSAVASSSVFLDIDPTDNTNVLSWSEDVPWINSLYYVFRADENNDFILVDSTTLTSYRDEGLMNGREYCYKIQSKGSYGIEDIRSPLLNFSQESCDIPIDNVAPCPPTLEVDDICDELVNCTEEDNIFNTLNWTNPINDCEDTDDVVGYNVYYSPVEGGEFDLIASFDDSNALSFEHKPERGIAGCYAVSAVDTFFNESILSNIVCIDNCPSYELPNTFTPNGDGFNDLFKPFPYCFVDQVSFRVFNRWGQLVWETNNPDLNWNGNNLGGNALPSGVYYYTCQVFEQRVNGSIPRPELLSGYIELLKGD